MDGDDFVGRAAQLAHFDRVVGEVGAGRGGFVLVGGEPGIGKTRLALEVARRATERGLAVAWASCPESGAPALWPWTQVLRAFDDVTVPDPPSPSDDPALARFLLFDRVETALRDAARHRPSLLVFDDLHWADEASLLLLAFVAARLVTAPIAVLGTSRDGPEAPDLLHDLVRHGRRMALGGLSVDEVAELVARHAGRPATHPEAEALHARTRGNPLFAVEVVRVAAAEGGTPADAPVPDSIRGVVRRRLARLGDNARRILATAAVLGTSFRFDVLAEVAQAGVLEPLGEVVAAGLVREAGAGRYAFTHDLVREAVYAGVGVAARVRLHERVADALLRRAAAGIPVEPAELAHHFTLAAPAGRAAEAVTYARAAAERAMSALAFETAARHLEGALALLELDPRAADAGELQLLLADARLAAGDLPAARKAFLAAAVSARASGRADRLARAALGLGGGPTGFEVPPFDREQVALLEEALTASTPRAPERPWLLARLSVALSMDAPVARRLELAEHAVTLARETDEQAALAHALAARCDAVAGPEDAERRAAAAAEIVRIAVERRDTRTELLGRRLRIVALLETGDVVGVDAEIIAYERAVDAIRQPLYAWYVPLWRGMQAAAAGRIAHAERWLAGTEAAGVRSANAALLAAVQRWFLLLETGDAARQLAATRAVCDAIGRLGTTEEVGLALGTAVAGDCGSARRRLDALGLDRLAAVPRDSEWLAMLTELADLVGLLGGHPVAGWAYDALRPHRHRFVVEGIGAYWHGSAERPLGVLAAVLGRTAEAREHFDAALAAHRRVGAALLVARTLRDAGAALGDAGLLGQAEDAYRALGVDRWAGEPRRLPPGRATATFRRDGEVWTLGWRGRTVLLRDSKGMHDLACLLGRPGQEVPTLDLSGVRGGDLGEMVDATARAAYRTRLGELDAELAEADAAGDVERSSRAMTERDALLAQLTAAYGLGGRPRRAGDPAERARSTVTARIRDALRRIERAHPELARHLRHCVHTGAYCSYRPEDPVDWAL